MAASLRILDKADSFNWWTSTATQCHPPLMSNSALLKVMAKHGPITEWRLHGAVCHNVFCLF